MLPTDFNVSPGNSRQGRVSLVILQVTDSHRATLGEWRAELERLMQRNAACRRTFNASLHRHFASALKGASEAICAACAPEKNEVITQAAETIRQYFRHAGDARAAAMRFPAVVEMGNFLRGPSPADTLQGLAGQAKATAALIGRILDGGTVWHFGEAKE